MKKLLIIIIQALVLTSCFPYKRFQKYSEHPSQVNNKIRVNTEEDRYLSLSTADKKINKISKNKFIIPASSQGVWEASLDILSNAYSLTLADRENGLIATEWDRFYREGNIYRNKLSIRFNGTDKKGTVVTIHNNIERLEKDPSQEYRPIWLPTNDPTKEVFRLLKNLAILLELKPPQKAFAKL